VRSTTRGGTTRDRLTAFVAAIGILTATAEVRAQAPGTPLDPIPAELETRWALSALPPALREGATVHRLVPRKGYELARQGTNGMTCLVQRTVWESGELRNDIYIPLCYDAAGTSTYLRVIMDAAALRARGVNATTLKATIAGRYADGTYPVPARAGLSYMMAAVVRTYGLPDMQVHTWSMPHLMFYAPHVTNGDIGATPDPNDLATLRYPFIDRQGNGEQSYMIQMLGEAETAKLLADEKPLIDALCAYRSLLCLGHEGAP
jgi:hypothetical protein